MKSVLKKDLTLMTSHCDSSAKLGVHNAFSLFMDLATEHANYLGVGSKELGDKGLIWVASKTKAIFYNRPTMMQNVTISTWPEKPEKIRFNRYYTIKNENELMISGKTEWAAIDKTNGRPKKADGIYPETLEFCTDSLDELEFSKITTDFSDSEFIDSYKVKSTDIDLYGHMNNVAYIRALFGLFTIKEIEDMNINSFEINYRIPCFEGDVLKVYKQNTEQSITIGMINKDGLAATVIKIN